jgi:K+-sensing histidine kinase KdpD
MQRTKDNLLESAIQLVSGHAFRNNMNVICGFAHFMHDNPDYISAKKRKEFSLHILRSAASLMAVSERVERWYGLQKGSAENDATCCLSSDLLLEIITADADQYLSDGQAFMYTSSVAELRIMGMEQIIVAGLKELFNNAFKFSAPHTLPSILVFEKSGNYHIRIINFSDKVSAIELKTYTVFTRFHTGGTMQDGLGLGMEIAGLSIRQCGGEILILENDDQGPLQKITVEVILPKQI